MCPARLTTSIESSRGRPRVGEERSETRYEVGEAPVLSNGSSSCVPCIGCVRRRLDRRDLDRRHVRARRDGDGQGGHRHGARAVPRPERGRQPALTLTVCQPLAPSGAGGVGPSSWTAPVPSVARTWRVCVPGVVVHGTTHWTQVAAEIGFLTAAHPARRRRSRPRPWRSRDRVPTRRRRSGPWSRPSHHRAACRSATA
jgi:hypothetical protein